MPRLNQLRHLLADEGGQDLVEYALLAAIVALAGILVFPQIQASMVTAFTGTNQAAYDLWCPDDPGGGATCSVEP